MRYEFTGRLCVRPCPGVTRPLGDTRVILYRLQDEGYLREATEARSKVTYDVASPADDDAVVIGDGETDADGNFSVTIDAKGYEGQPFVVAALVGDPAGRDDVSPVEVTLTAVEPEWEQTEEGMIARWDHCLNEKQWCALLDALDLWMVCGRVLDCLGESEDPVSGVTVTAFDADIIQHDELGSDVTDASGGYVIYYTTADFEKVPSPFKPIELRHGPDLYFEVTSDDGDPLLEESTSDGREPGREDVGHCAHVDLCLDIPDVSGPMAWLSVGGAFDVPDDDSLNDFDADGYAGGKKWALTGTLNMRGSTPSVTDPSYEDVRYRFRFAESTAKNDEPEMGEAAFTDAVGDIDNEGAFRNTKIGMAVRYDPFDFFPVVARGADVDEDGWLSTKSALENSAPAGVALDAYELYDNDTLMRVNTNAITTEPDISGASVEAGNEFPDDQELDVETFAFRFEAQVEQPDGTVTDLPASGQTLNRAVINNSGMFGALELVEQEDAPCEPITTDDVTVRYTVYHPHPGSAQIRLISNDEDETDASNWTTINDGAGTSEVSFSRSSESGADLKAMSGEHYNASLAIDGEVDDECTYVLELRTQRRLHTGNSAADSGWRTHRQISFYAEEP